MVILSINPNPGDILFLPGDICKIHLNSTTQYISLELRVKNKLPHHPEKSFFDF
jgi:hypothetical protein